MGSENGISRVRRTHKNKKKPEVFKKLPVFQWRRVWDSNPEYNRGFSVAALRESDLRVQIRVQFGIQVDSVGVMGWKKAVNSF